MDIDEIRELIKEVSTQHVSKKTGNISFKRSIKLIVSKVTWDDVTRKGALNNSDWAYHVGYCFRDAIDLQFERRMKDKKPYMVWTQGHIIHFKEGDTFTSNRELSALQVQTSKSMQWNDTEKEIDQGSVTYAHLSDVKHGALNTAVKTVTQMEFLEILITGITINVNIH